MRVTILLFFLGVGSVFADSSYSQNTKLSINLKKCSIQHVFNEIQRQSEFIIIYNDKQVDTEHEFDIKFKNSTVDQILDVALDEIGLTYTIYDRQIVIYPKSEPEISQQLNPIVQEKDEKRVSGTVMDKKGIPLPGVSIVVKGTSIGTITDVNGIYSLDVPKDAILVFSFIGMKNREMPAESKAVRVVLEEETTDLEEVMVVGYGTQKKASVVGAIQNIKPTELGYSSSKNISNALAGKLGGIIAVTRSGEPGYDQSDFWIRGISSFSGDTDPLVLVDGIQRTLDDIDISEIASFSILKDAAASAMYGVRGANGVIIINTKRGKIQKPVIEVNVEHTITTPTKLPSFIDAADYMQLLNDLAAEEDKVAYYDDYEIEYTRNGYDPELYPDVNWIDAISKDWSSNTRANMNVNGGTDLLRYNLTGSVYQENGILNRDKSLSYDTGTKLTRYNMRSNVDINLSKTTSMRFSVGGYLQKLRKQANSTDNTWDYAFDTPPMVHPAVYANGKIPCRSNRQNPWAYLTQYGYLVETKSKIESLISVEQNFDFITKGLSSKISFSFDKYSKSRLYRDKDPTYYYPATSRNLEGSLILDVLSEGEEFLDYDDKGYYGNDQTYLEWMINYDRIFNKIHNVNGMLLYNQRSYDDGDIQPYRNQGIAGRFSYSYNNKYVGEFNFGYNGSENFAKGQRYGFFPSVALGWIISEETFWENIKDKINFMKLRLSWGQAGNDQIGSDRRFAYVTTIDTDADGYSWGYDGDNSHDGVTEGDIGVSNLTWETVTKKNIGLEIGLYDALNVTFDLFDEFREDIFMQRNTIPTQSGIINTPYANFGKVSNKGGEISLNFNKKINKVNLSLFGNVSYAKNKIKEHDVAEGKKGTAQDITNHSIDELYGYQALRLYTDDDFDASGDLLEDLPVNELDDVRPGDIMFKDWNEDGVINDLDKGYIGGTADPKLVYGFGGSVEWNGMDFSIFFQGLGKTYRIIGDESEYFIPGSGQGIQGNIYTNDTDRWTEDNPSQDVFWPRLSYSTNYNNYCNSTWWKKDMSFLRLKQIEIGYSFSKAVRKNLLKKCRIYINANNLLTFSDFKLWDPELSTETGCKYPQMKSVMIGLNITL